MHIRIHFQLFILNIIGDIINSCPPTCFCDIPNTLTVIVNCEGRGLFILPTILPQNTSVAIFSRNNLTFLNTASFIGCTKLKLLILSACKIKTIATGTFESLHHLQLLDLQGNALDFAKSNSVEDGAFEDLVALEQLSIENNNVTSDVLLRTELFQPLSNIRHLSLDLPAYAQFNYNTTQWLSRLERLEIYGLMKYVSNITFATPSLSNVSYLGIHTHLLEDVEPLAFAHFTKLHTLNLSFNKPLGLNNASKAWYGLRFTRVNVLDLTQISPYDNKLIKMESSFFREINLVNITTAIFDRNAIIEVEEGLYNGFPNIRYLSFNHNHLYFVKTAMTEFMRLKSVQYFSASFQVLRTLKRRDLTSVNFNTTFKVSRTHNNFRRFYRSSAKNSSFIKKHQIISNLNNNTASTFIPDTSNCSNFSQQSKLTESVVKIVGNRIKNALGDVLPYPDVFLTKAFPLPLPRCLRYLHMSQTWNENIDILPPFFLLGNLNLRLVNYSDNGFTVLRGPIYLNKPSRYKVTVDLSRNMCNNLSPNLFFYSCQYFDKLFLSHNDIGKQLVSDENGVIFQSCTELVLLDLAYNNIRNLPQNVFKNQSKLVYLNLSTNSMRTVEFSFEHMRNLQLIDLSANLIEYLDEKTISQIDSIDHLVVDLTDNPLLCDCQSLDFLRWLDRLSPRMRNFERYECFFTIAFNNSNTQHANNLVSFRHLRTSILPSLNVQCYSKEWLKVGAFGIVFCIGLIIAYCLRWNIIYCCSKFRYQKNQYMHLKQKIEARDYEFAAFVSFDSRDLEWIENHLKAAIHSAEYPLYIYTDHFMPGEMIDENIQRALDKTLKTILVISNNFVDSEWCYYEARMAFQKCVNDGIDSIIPILLEEVNLKRLPNDIRRYLRNYVYLTWPTKSDEQTEFFNKLRRLLLPTRYASPSQNLNV